MKLQGLDNRVRYLLLLALAAVAVLIFSALVQSSQAAGDEETVVAQETAVVRDHDDDIDLLEQDVLPLELALIGAEEALEACADDGFSVSVTIVDAAGVQRVHLRDDGAGPHTIGSSAGKAYTAASLKRATLGLANFIADRPDLHGLRDMDDRILILGGGLPITIDDEVVGGIGVGGAPGGDLDEACAQAGIDEILDRVDD